MKPFVVNQGEGVFVQMIDGVQRKNLVVGKETMLCEFHLQQGKVLPLHHHSQEQTGYLMSGCLLFEIDGEEMEMKAGDSWSIGGDVPHKVTVLETAVVIETFTPLRQDFLSFFP